MKTFDTEFPSLKDRIFCNRVSLENIKSFCLDKQKVREAIEYYENNVKKYGHNYCWTIMKKELDL